MRRIGFFSGTFDPFHYAHLEACLIAKEICKLDEILILLEHNPKRKQNVTSHQHRYKMIQLAIEDYNGISVENAPADNITFDVLQPMIEQRFKHDELWYILGSDILEHLPSWDGVEQMLEQMNLCVVLRNNHDKTITETVLHKLQYQHKKLRYELLPEVWSEISSTKIRKQIHQSSISEDVPLKVMDYIRQNLLY